MRKSLLPFRSLCAAGAAVACAAACAGDPATAKGAPRAGSCGLPRFEAELLRLVNEFRAAPRRCGARGNFAAAGPLRWSPALAQLADTHARGMATRNEVEHADARGRGPAERATAAGYAWRVFAENIAGNYSGTAEVMAGWQSSAGHCANLMNAELAEFGVACAAGAPGNAFKTYWAMELAKPR